MPAETNPEVCPSCKIGELVTTEARPDEHWRRLVQLLFPPRVTPTMGRDFQKNENNRPATSNVMILSYAFWNLLHSLGYSVDRPRRRLARANAWEQDRWHRYTYPNLKKKPKGKTGR